MRPQSICLALVIFLLCPFASAQWVKTSTGLTDGDVRALVVSNTNLYAGTYFDGVFRSTDNGLTWLAVNNGLTADPVFALAVSDTNLYAGTSHRGVLLSTDNGTTWRAINNGLTDSGVYALEVSDTNIYAGTDNGVFFSTNNGINWNTVDTGYHPIFVRDLAAIGKYLFSGSCGVDVSTDKGTSWSHTNVAGCSWSLAVSDTNLFAGGSTWARVFLSTDYGQSWSEVDSGLPSGAYSHYQYATLAAYDKNLYVGVSSNLIPNNYGASYLSTNNGTSWRWIDDGVPYNLGTRAGISCFAASGPYLFAATAGDGIWRRAFSDLLSVNANAADVPAVFSLGQNYPNPFNPTTAIKYELPKSSDVRLSVFDMLGREVSVLVNERRDAGVHEVKFDGSNLASGVYFYRLHAGDFAETKTLILLR